MHIVDVVNRSDSENKEAGEIIRYRDKDIVVFDAKFPMCRFQYNIIPTIHIDNIKSLSKGDINLLENMYSKGVDIVRKALKEENHIFFKDDEQTVDHMYIGYNYPPSVDHLQ